MEVATTNNHSQSHHHHLQPHSHHRHGGGGGGARSPFQREVREWQRIDPDTGALFSGRLEADRWINGPLNSYGKISDSQNISQPNGTQHTQRKQLEVLQARTSSGAMQVIRTQTVQKTSSTSRWSSASCTTTTSSSHNPHWAPLGQSVDICEVSDGDDSSSSNSDVDVGSSRILADDHVDFVVINGQEHADDDSGDDDEDNVGHLHKPGHNLLLDTAPSLKLSNLMKSSSSISSQSSNNSNLTTATATTTTTNTHRKAGKISLHAIVGQTAATAAASSSSLSSSQAATSASTPWHKRLAEQPDLYGSSLGGLSSKLKPLRVGGVGAGAVADVAVATPTQRRDLESFRHYNDDGNSNENASVAADAEDLRLSARHQRRQQVSQSVYAPPVQLLPLLPLQRSRSISTDDLSNDWERGQQSDEEEPGEWRRVSKLRRSFQSQDYHTKATPSRRPLDLPSNSVSVSRIRAELENGRRLNTAMRNNHVDLAALDNILNTPALTATKPAVAKRSTFLTAESLQEIRGKLKKLSDESLYKEDFLAYQARRAERLEEQPVEREEQPVASAFRPVRVPHNTHSLESRQRQKDNSASEWHLRRKSYGFEKMSPPEDKSIYRVDASTDSGLGRSGEQLGNWSPTERSAGGTIIHFGIAQKRPPTMTPKLASSPEGELSKRHSIAVEETWRDVRKTSQVHVNGAVESVATASQLQQRSSAQKRVEFCKTEVHFAAESGRVNIVETDGKPPPTQNFRRRRRTASGPLQSLVKSASVSSSSSSSSSVSSSSQITHFGDDTQRHKALASSTVGYRATLMEPPELVTQPANAMQVTVTTMPKPMDARFSLLEATSTSRNSTSTSGVDTTDNETDELANIRGILKNKPVKPKPYHLGDNIESADVLWSMPASKSTESPPSREIATSSESPIPTKSVAERVRIVEQRQFESTSNQQQQQQQPSPVGNGYSTKINLNLGAEDWQETGASNVGQRRASAQELLLQDLRAHQRVLDEGLKSTSLIMKTMRSASEFDEAMRRLSIASMESALMPPSIVVPTPMLRSHSYQESSCSSRRASTTSITSSDLFGSTLYDSLPRVPPRLKLLGNTQIPVSQQLLQLRRLYDAAGEANEEEVDSADEEVKRYFRDNSNSDSGGGTQDSSSLEDVRTAISEYSGSWSRLKAKRTIWKIEAQEQTLQRADVPKSNVMSIALHAQPKLEKPKATPPTLRIGQLVPVAKPRTLFVQPQPQPQLVEATDDSGSESLKIVKEARGARKLREHELSYFGVKQQQQQQTNQIPALTKLNATSTNPRRTLPTRSKLTHNEDANATTTTTTKWQLLNDRPDLLRHSPHGIEAQPPIPLPIPTGDSDEHCYENIANELTTTFRVKSPSPMNYERKADLQRDAQILSEMTRNADQTMKALSDEAALKDQRRRSTSLQRRSAKPLETIDEKVYIAERQALSVARGTFASEARRNSRHSTPSPTCARSSSQSSIECPRARSRSLSSEREYPAPTKTTRPRSSSRESMSDEPTTKPAPPKPQLREERLRMRTPKREKSRHEEPERVRQSSKQRASSNSTSTAEPKRVISGQGQSSSVSRSRHRETESGKQSSGTRLLRASRVSEESRMRASGTRVSEREKHREEPTPRSRGHSSRSRHSEAQPRSKAAAINSNSNSSSTTTAHKKSTTKSTSSTKATHKASSGHNTTTPSHNELTHGKNAQLNGHHHSSKHSGHGQPPQHHVHSLTTTTIAATKQQRERHGKDRK